MALRRKGLQRVVQGAIATMGVAHAAEEVVVTEAEKKREAAAAERAALRKLKEQMPEPAELISITTKTDEFSEVRYLVYWVAIPVSSSRLLSRLLSLLLSRLPSLLPSPLQSHLPPPLRSPSPVSSSQVAARLRMALSAELESTAAAASRFTPFANNADNAHTAHTAHIPSAAGWAEGAKVLGDIGLRVHSLSNDMERQRFRDHVAEGMVILDCWVRQNVKNVNSIIHHLNGLYKSGFLPYYLIITFPRLESQVGHSCDCQ